MTMGSSLQIRLNPPYVLCRGKEKCRCVQLYLYSGRRERSTIAASGTAGLQPVDSSAIAAAIRESMSLLAGTLRAEVESIVAPIRTELEGIRTKPPDPPPPPQPDKPVNVSVAIGGGKSVEFIRDAEGRLTGFVEHPMDDASASDDETELAYNVGELRVPKGAPTGGRWTTGVAGARPGSEGNEVFFASPSDAIVALEAGRHVTIAREDLHNVLMRAKDSPVNDIDLTKLTIEDTPLFAGGLNRARDTMPQIPKDHRDGFIEHVKSQGVQVRQHNVNPLSLLPTQNEINAGRVGDKLSKYERGSKLISSIFASSDDYVLDGHHRWAVAASVAFISPTARIRQPVTRLMTDRDRALKLMDDYMKLHNIPRESLEFSALRGLDIVELFGPVV
jgi:hypothetical protein